MFLEDRHHLKMMEIEERRKASQRWDLGTSVPQSERFWYKVWQKLRSFFK